MKENQNVKRLMKLGYNFEDVLDIWGFRFGLGCTFRYDLSPEGAVRMYRIFGKNYVYAGLVCDFIERHYHEMGYKENDGAISSEIIVNELEENLDFWKEKILEGFGDVMQNG